MRSRVCIAVELSGVATSKAVYALKSGMRQGNETFMSKTIKDKPDITQAGWQRLTLEHMPLALTITNPRLKDNPLIYVNRAFERITGYTLEAVYGLNCRFLQGPGTDPAAVRRIREAVEREEEITIDILNYRANGNRFWNRLLLTPVYDEAGELAYFIGVQRALGEQPGDMLIQGMTKDDQLQEIQHRVKNHLQMIVSMVRMQSRQPQRENGTDYKMLAHRIEALQLLYNELIESGITSVSKSSVALGAYVTRIVSAVGYIDGRRGLRLNVDADTFDVKLDVAGRIGLIVSELLTNAFQHAFEGRDSGLIEVRLQQLSGGIIRLKVTDDGIGMKSSDWPKSSGMGGRIIRTLVGALDARLSVDTGVTGTSVTVDIPFIGETTEEAN